MDRRNVVTGAGAAIAAIAVMSGSDLVAAVRQEPKAWARQRLKGLESILFPSFTPNLEQLDEAGIRRDVRHAIDQGFLSIIPTAIGTSEAESDKLAEIAVDEANGRLLLVAPFFTKDWALQERDIRRAERLGFSHLMMVGDANLPTQEVIYERMRDLIQRTSLAVVLYASPSAKLKHLDPTGVPLDAFDRLADLPNVVAVKLTQIITDDTALKVASRLGDRLLIGPVNFEQIPLLLRAGHRIQWSGQWGIDGLQSPQQPYAVQFMKLLEQGKTTEAMALYSRFGSAARAFYGLQDPYLRVGSHPSLHIKYYQWLTGGNGGLLRSPRHAAENMPVLDAEGRRKCREAFRAAGIKTVDLPDEAFVVGTEAYNRGARARDLSSTPHYVA